MYKNNKEKVFERHIRDIEGNNTIDNDAKSLIIKCFRRDTKITLQSIKSD